MTPPRPRHAPRSRRRHRCRTGRHGHRPVGRTRPATRSSCSSATARPGRPGNILNLWPPPAEGAARARRRHRRPRRPLHSEFRNADGKVRVDVKLPEHVAAGVRRRLHRAAASRALRAACSPRCRRRRHAVQPQVDRIDQDETGGHAALRRRRAPPSVDVLDRRRRHRLAGPSDAVGRLAQARAPPAHLRRVHLRRRTSAPMPGQCVVSPQPHGAGQLDVDPHQGPRRLPVVGAHRAPTPTRPRRPTCTPRPRRWAPSFPAPAPRLIAATEPENVQRWVLRDRPPLKQWSKGRATLVGDAAHPTSPTPPTARACRSRTATSSVVALRGVDLARPGRGAARAAGLRGAAQAAHGQAGAAWPGCSARSSTTRPRRSRPVRDFIFDHTPFLQKIAGDSNPREINKQLALIEG